MHPWKEELAGAKQQANMLQNHLYVDLRPTQSVVKQCKTIFSVCFMSRYFGVLIPYSSFLTRFFFFFDPFCLWKAGALKQHMLILMPKSSLGASHAEMMKRGGGDELELEGAVVA